jgi:hypothetical protein
MGSCCCETPKFHIFLSLNTITAPVLQYGKIKNKCKFQLQIQNFYFQLNCFNISNGMQQLTSANEIKLPIWFLI